MKNENKTFLSKYLKHLNLFIRIGQSPLDLLQDHPHNNCQRLHVTAPLGLSQNYLHKLFNLIPGLEYCDLNEQTGKLVLAL